MDKKIVIVKPKAISIGDKQQLKKAGFIVIETDDPEAIKVYDQFGAIEDTLVLETALQALEWGNDPTCRQAFGNLIRQKLIVKYKVKKPTS